MAKQVIKLGETVKSILSKLNANFSELYTESAKITNKVDKVAGKGLSENDYTTAEKEKLAGIATGAQVNVIETLKVDGVTVTPNGKAVNIDLSIYAKKTEISGIYKYKGSVAIVSALPTTGNEVGDVYNVEAGGMNYAWDGEKWDSLGAIIDLSDYVKTSDMNTALGGKVDKVEGKGLSTNDFTNAYKEKLDRSTQVEKLTFASSVWGTAVDGYYTYTLAGGGKYPVKVMRQSDSDYVEAVVDIAMSGTNIVITSEEVFSGYVITI